MSIINPPPQSPVDVLNGQSLVNVTEGWRNWFNSVFTVCASLTQSGTTAQRPTRILWVGRRYFDTTLSKPVWYVGPGWVDATGAPA